MSADYSKDGFATTKAILISKAMRKLTSTIGRQRIALVFTNQLRQKMGVMFGDPWTTSGGKALAFHASVRLRLKNLGQIKQGSTTDVIGNKCEATIVKNRMEFLLKEKHLLKFISIVVLMIWEVGSLHLKLIKYLSKVVHITPMLILKKMNTSLWQKNFQLC